MSLKFWKGLDIQENRNRKISIFVDILDTYDILETAYGSNRKPVVK